MFSNAGVSFRLTGTHAPGKNNKKQKKYLSCCHQFGFENSYWPIAFLISFQKKKGILLLTAHSLILARYGIAFISDLLFMLFVFPGCLGW